MALPATRVVVAMKDTSAADLTGQGDRLPVEVGLRLPQRRGRRHRLPLDPRPDPARGLRRRQADRRRLPVPRRQPAGRAGEQKIRVITTANDVIHAWGVPSLGVKQDALPGFVRDTWFKADREGDFYGQCFELCGKEHAYMPIHVKVLSQQAYSAWVGERKKEMAAKADDPSKVWDLAGLQARGEQVYTANCQVCHQANGKGGSGVKPLDASRSCSTPTRPSRSTPSSRVRNRAPCRRGSS
jgi:cytochrome c oxidase subunit 2